MKQQINKMGTVYRQGDVLIRRIKSIPSGAEKQLRAGRSIVLGEGETAGHRHEILETSKAEAYKLAEGLYIEVEEETALTHPEHDQIALLPGSYEVIRQSEFVRKVIARVTD